MATRPPTNAVPDRVAGHRLRHVCGIGIMISDERGRTIASPFENYTRARRQAGWRDHFRRLAIEESIVLFVIGLPDFTWTGRKAPENRVGEA